MNTDQTEHVTSGAVRPVERQYDADILAGDELQSWIDEEESIYGLLGAIVPELVELKTRITGEWNLLAHTDLVHALDALLVEHTGVDFADECRATRPARGGVEQERETAVYRAFDAQSMLLYVGVTVSPSMRMRAHGKTSEWWREMQSVRFEWFTSRREALARERELIVALRPPFNDVFNPDAAQGATALIRQGFPDAVSGARKADG